MFALLSLLSSSTAVPPKSITVFVIVRARPIVRGEVFLFLQHDVAGDFHHVATVSERGGKPAVVVGASAAVDVSCSLD